MPAFWNAGSTVSGPSSSAGIAPQRIFVMMFEPTSSGPTQATKDSEASGGTPSRKR